MADKALIQSSIASTATDNPAMKGRSDRTETRRRNLEPRRLTRRAAASARPVASGQRLREGERGAVSTFNALQRKDLGYINCEEMYTQHR